jgi:hypothetical protein
VTLINNDDDSVTLIPDTGNKIRSMCFSDGSTLDGSDKSREERVRKIVKSGGAKHLQEVNSWDIRENDFPRNIIIQGRTSIEEHDSDGSFTIELNSILHDEEPGRGLGGTGYHFTLEWDGKVNHEKEMGHSDIGYAKQEPSGRTFDTHLPVTFAHVTFDDDSGNTHLESYLDYENSNEFVLVKETTDRNDFGNKMNMLDPSFRPGECVRWTSPIIVLKANRKKIRIYDFKIVQLV